MIVSQLTLAIPMVDALPSISEGLEYVHYPSSSVSLQEELSQHLLLITWDRTRYDGKEEVQAWSKALACPQNWIWGPSLGTHLYGSDKSYKDWSSFQPVLVFTSFWLNFSCPWIWKASDPCPHSSTTVPNSTTPGCSVPFCPWLSLPFCRTHPYNNYHSSEHPEISTGPCSLAKSKLLAPAICEGEHVRRRFKQLC